MENSYVICSCLALFFAENCLLWLLRFFRCCRDEMTKVLLDNFLLVNLTLQMFQLGQCRQNFKITLFNKWNCPEENLNSSFQLQFLVSMYWKYDHHFNFSFWFRCIQKMSILFLWHHTLTCQNIVKIIINMFYSSWDTGRMNFVTFSLWGSFTKNRLRREK